MITSIQNRATIGKVMALGFLLAALLMAACLLLAARPAHAATTFSVDRNDDPDPTTANACTEAPSDCSLRGALVAANAVAGADDITLPAGTYTLSRAGANEDAASTGDLDITEELTITGAGARATSVAGGPAPYQDRIFDNQPGATATITDLTITGGNAGGYEGGGVRNRGDLTLDAVDVKDNTAGTGGGIDSRGGDLTLDGVTVKGNTSGGYTGGIYSENGTLNITDSTVSGNSADKWIGGVSQSGGPAKITNSTISGNKAAQFGGGVLAHLATINIRNSTIASNKTGGLGGGIMTFGPGSLFVLKNTIVASNTLLDNCADFGQLGGVIYSQGNNISTDDSCGFTQSTDKQNTNPLLGPLQNNGGPTDTHALLPGSPAVDAAGASACPERDQRGVPRKDGDKNGTVVCDIGAFERNDLTAPKVTITTPTDAKRGVKRTTDLTATFSERMDRATLNKATFKLFKVNRDGSTTQITAVSVSTSTEGLKATLNPDSTLRANTEYKAVVTTGAKDVAGNRLDQHRKQPNNQPMEWTFTTGSS